MYIYIIISIQSQNLKGPKKSHNMYLRCIFVMCCTICLCITKLHDPRYSRVKIFCWMSHRPRVQSGLWCYSTTCCEEGRIDLVPTNCNGWCASLILVEVSLENVVCKVWKRLDRIVHCLLSTIRQLLKIFRKL